MDARADGGGRIWADARGLDAQSLARDLLTLLGDDGVADACAGVASTPIAAELAAVRGNPGVNVVQPGTDREFVAVFPVDALEVPARVHPLLFAIGVQTCGGLAGLQREAVEVRLGAEAVTPWRRARADDDRCHTLFAPMPRDVPHASMEWMEYEVKDPARLLFVINALLERVCDELAGEGRGAREMTLDFSLANRTTHTELLRAARVSASRHVWIRLVRLALDRMRLLSAVTGISLRATRTMERGANQRDLFDTGFATAEATEEAIARLIEDQGDVVVTARNSAHPLIEERTMWESSEQQTENGSLGTATNGERRTANGERTARSSLTLQLTAIPQSVLVETVVRRDHFAPARYHDATGWHEIVHAAGPDRVSSGAWKADRAYAREYFRCVTRDGALVWLFRDAHRRNAWYLHGWWD